jgi:hypothetical protein
MFQNESELDGQRLFAQIGYLSEKKMPNVNVILGTLRSFVWSLLTRQTRTLHTPKFLTKLMKQTLTQLVILNNYLCSDV